MSAPTGEAGGKIGSPSQCWSPPHKSLLEILWGGWKVETLKYFEDRMSVVREVEFGKRQANPLLVEMLEEWLKRAKDGSVQAVGIAGVKPDGCISTEWGGLGGGWLHQMNSAVLVLQHRILQANIDPE